MIPARVALLAVVALLAASCGGHKSSSSTAAPPPATTAPTTTPTVPGGGGKIKAHRKGGQLLAGTKNLYPLLSGNIQRLAPIQVTGKNVPVLAVVGPSLVWVGRNATERLLLSVRLKGTPAKKVQVGEKADFVGALLQSSGPQAGSLGLKSTSDRAKLTQQGAYVDVSVADLKLHH